MDNPYSPFANGTQFDDWQACNCERCTKYNPDAETMDAACRLEWILSVGGETADGSVTEETALQCGYLRADGTEETRYVWPCAIVEWTDEWKAEIARRRAAQKEHAQ